MKLGNFAIIGSLAAILSGAMPLLPVQAAGQDQEIEELTRGPVHEAFAVSVSFNPEPGMVVDKTPPELIEEIPPEQRPEGDNISWIPGYWGWDEEQSDFIWISGVWRNLPPGRQWVPGYWSEAEGGWQWTSGYWADEEQQEVEYLPAPPKSIESGPNVKAPSENHVWVSGNWAYRENRYAWTPGYWEPAQPRWVWIPAHYRWTPCGHVFIAGYWDYDVNRRGMIFAPVRIHHDVYSRPGYAYTPLMVISLNAFVSHMFVRPTYCHYYFGDYYSTRYRDHGYYAPHLYNAGHRGYDSFYVHNRWQHRDDRNWERRQIDDYNYFRDHENARPPRNWKDMQARPDAGVRDRVAKHRDKQRFEKVDQESRDKIVEQRQKMREFGQDRKRLEKTDSKPSIDPGRKPDPVKPEVLKRGKFGKSPLVSKPAKNLTGKDAPPQHRDSPRDSDRRKPSDKDLDPGNNREVPGTSDKLKNPDGTRNMRPDLRKREPDNTRKPETDPKRVKEDNPPPKRIIRPEPERRKLPETKRESEPPRIKKPEPQGNREPAREPKKQVIPEMPRPKKQALPEKQPEIRRQITPEPRRQPTRQPESMPSSGKKQKEDESSGESKKNRDR
jgi:WXXGXW repeat (2 copies)